jgi:hypothetical protein
MFSRSNNSCGKIKIIIRYAVNPLVGIGNQVAIAVKAVFISSFNPIFSESVYPDTASSIRSRRLLTPLVPSKVSAPDKAALEELQLVNELDEEEKNILLKLIETFVSKKKI